ERRHELVRRRGVAMVLEDRRGPQGVADRVAVAPERRARDRRAVVHLALEPRRVEAADALAQRVEPPAGAVGVAGLELDQGEEALRAPRALAEAERRELRRGLPRARAGVLGAVDLAARLGVAVDRDRRPGV